VSYDPIWGGSSSSFHVRIFLYAFQEFGGGGSVRRRNTLHVVGGRQFLSQARFMGREKKEIIKYFIRNKIFYMKR
jgi:hypothetical protein